MGDRDFNIVKKHAIISLFLLQGALLYGIIIHISQVRLGNFGMWRSPVARTLGVGEVQGSNPCIPTISMKIEKPAALQASFLAAHEHGIIKIHYWLPEISFL